jgi:hypothetical protein
MEKINYQELLDKLRLLRQSDNKPFAYKDCRKLSNQHRGKIDDLIRDLNTYFMDIAGFCSGDYQILHLPKATLLSAINRLSISFFEKHSKYNIIKDQITEENTPDLFADFKLCENMRMLAIELISKLLQTEMTSGDKRK